jgi:hypothetical protein
MWRNVLGPSFLAVTILACVTRVATTDSGTVTTTTGSDPASRIANAMSAAPPSIANAATIMDWPSAQGGQARQLRAGSNGWVCYPSTPAAAGAPGEDPMCLDRAFQEWAGAWMSKTQPRITMAGVAYMLRGDRGVSNTDPYATAPTADNQWIQSGPHVMVITPDPSAFATVSTDPRNGGPWVMWPGTPYAHLMVPIR